jgi:hypothetical protein
MAKMPTCKPTNQGTARNAKPPSAGNQQTIRRGPKPGGSTAATAQRRSGVGINLPISGTVSNPRSL